MPQWRKKGISDETIGPIIKDAASFLSEEGPLFFFQGSRENKRQSEKSFQFAGSREGGDDVMLNRISVEAVRQTVEQKVKSDRCPESPSAMR